MFLLQAITCFGFRETKNAAYLPAFIELLTESSNMPDVCEDSETGILGLSTES